MSDLLNMSGKEIVSHVFTWPIVVGLAAILFSSIFLVCQWIKADTRLVYEAQWCLAVGMIMVLVGRAFTGPILIQNKK